VRNQRCAVYIRKSTEEGLDMEFNLLDAQREACQAYIASHRPEGWLPTTAVRVMAAIPARRSIVRRSGAC
jgi:hypothetical protein